MFIIPHLGPFVKYMFTRARTWGIKKRNGEIDAGNTAHVEYIGNSMHIKRYANGC